MAEEEWEMPVGLTKECAISIDDSSDDEIGKSCVVDGGDKVTNTNSIQSSLQYHESIKGGTSTASSSSYFNSSKPTTLTSKTNDKNRIDSCTAPSKTSSNESTDTTNNNDTQDVSIKIKSNIDVIAKKDVAVDNTKQPQDEGKADTTKNDNPFASFAFTSGEASSIPSSSSSWRSKKKLSHTNSKSSSHNNKQHTKRKNDNSISSSSSVVTKKVKQPHSFFNKSTGRSEDDIIRCKDKKYERQELITKWHAFADPNPNVPIEQQRFQVLVAARLHARCQEPVVLKAMNKLRKYFNEKDEGRVEDNDEVQATSSQPSTAATTSRSQQTSGRGLTVHNLANADPEVEIAPLLKSVLFGNVKSKHIVQAAKDLLQKFGGRVPESIVSLKSIMGIGPELAGVLNIVNKVDTYTQK